MTQRAFDVVVAGGGAIGCATGRSLADAGLDVAIVDPDVPEAQASRAAGGLLTPGYESDGPGALLELGTRSRALYPDFAAALREETGIDVELRRGGVLVLALTEQDERLLHEQADWQEKAGLHVQRLEPRDIRKLEPRAASDARRGLHLPDDIQVENRRLCRALRQSIRQRGVAWFGGDRVESLVTESGRLAGARLRSGRELRAGHLILAAGAWSGTIGGLPRRLPIRPLRGQMIQLEETGSSALRLTVASRRGYVVPRLDGRTLVGSTVEDAGFTRHTTARGVRDILDHAMELVDGLGAARITDLWAGIRPGTPDELPIIGPDPELPGLVYATGHFRNGILLTPITAQLVTGVVTCASIRVDLSPFAVQRFA